MHQGLAADPAWRRANSRWRYWTWALGLFTWVGFAWAAVRARKPWWGLAAAVYALPFALGPLLGPALGPLTLLVFVLGLLHVRRLLPEYLVERAAIVAGRDEPAREEAPAPVPDRFPIGSTVCSRAFEITAHLRGAPAAGTYRGVDGAGGSVLITLRPRPSKPDPALIGRLGHAGIAGVTPLLAIGPVDERLELEAMVEAEPSGRPLRTWQPCPVERVVGVAEALCGILAGAHAAGAVLEHLTPDLTYARADDRSAQVVVELAPRGPEFLRPAPPSRPRGPATDVFALCQLLAWLATGEHPFGGEQRRPWTGPPELGAILAPGLEPEPARRPPLSLLMAQLRRLPVENPSAVDHAAKVESFVRRFYAHDTHLVVNEATTEVPLVAANLSVSTRSFSAGQLLYVYDVYWGMNERAKVVGRYRGKNRFVTGVCRIDRLENARPKIAAHPGVVRALAGQWISGGIFLRFLDLPGGFKTFADYRDSVLGGTGDPAAPA